MNVGHSVAQKHTKKICAPSWLYLQDYTGTHGQQNIKFNMLWGGVDVYFKNHTKTSLHWAGKRQNL
jgi:hypothetical protein